MEPLVIFRTALIHKAKRLLTLSKNALPSGMVGTLKSQGSPSTPPWAAVHAAYQNDSFTAEWVARLVWRANRENSATDFARLLGTSPILKCLLAARQTNSPIAAIEAVTEVVANTRTVTLASDISKRAAIRMFETKDRTQGFVVALFEEATNYLVSRDLPSLVGKSSILATAKTARERKLSINKAVRTIAEEVSSSKAPKNIKDWKALVAEICGRLRNG